jgi:hypothetical protein
MIKKIETSYKNLNLEIDGLAEINYFVGKNGSGKTRLFEVLEKYNSSLNPTNKILNFSEDFQTTITREGDYTTIGFQPVDLNKLIGKKEKNISGGFISEQEITKIILKLIFDQEARFNDSDWTISIKENLKISLEETPSGFESLFKFWLTTFVNFPKNLKGSKLFWFVCLDELDRHLHPSISKKIPELLNKLQAHLFSFCLEKHNFEVSLQFFISTHSPFLIRGALQHEHHKIFHLEDGTLKNSFDKQKLIKQSGLPFDCVLRDLGFEMKDIYYPNCLIYVEGPTDILYIHYWLKLYIKEKGLKDFQKGIDFDFVEYGGTLASHLTATFINPEHDFDENLKFFLQNMFSSNRNVLFITDHDGGKSNFETAKNRIEKLLADNKQKGFNNEFIKCKSVVTIEEFIGEKNIANPSETKLNAAINNISSWKQNQNLMLSDFHPQLELELICRIYNFIELANKI